MAALLNGGSNASGEDVEPLYRPRPEDEEPAGARRAVPEPGCSEPPDVDISSVVTQVTSRDPGPYRGPSAALRLEPGGTPRDWRHRWRSLLCCFAPQTNGYFKSTDSEQVAVRSAVPPKPPAPNRLQNGYIIGPKHPQDTNKKTLVLDLDETLVHSSFKPIPNPDYIIPVEIDNKMVDVYVLKRPWLDHFMESIGDRFEIIIFTASLAKYADPLLDLLDKTSVVRWRLFRESCLPYEGNYVKDLSCLGRDLAHTIIVDNSPHSYVFQPSNAMAIGTFIDNMDDQELLELLPLLQQCEAVEDVRPVLGLQAQQQHQLHH